MARCSNSTCASSMNPRLHRSWPTLVATHVLALLVGAAVAWKLATPSFAPAFDAAGTDACADQESASASLQAAGPARSSPSAVARTVAPPSTNETEHPQAADAGRFIAELRAASAESDLRKLGAMPLPWPEDDAIPPGLRASAFEATVLRLADEMDVAPPDVDCGEYPCVARVPDGWTDEEFEHFQAALLDAVGVDQPATFGHRGARVVGVYSAADADDGLLKRIWMRTVETGRESVIAGTD